MVPRMTKITLKKDMRNEKNLLVVALRWIIFTEGKIH